MASQAVFGAAAILRRRKSGPVHIDECTREADRDNPGRALFASPSPGGPIKHAGYFFIDRFERLIGGLIFSRAVGGLCGASTYPLPHTVHVVLAVARWSCSESRLE